METSSFYSFLLLAFALHATSGCPSGRLLVSTLPNEYPEYQYTAGIYTILDGDTLNGAPIYKHEKFAIYLYFRPLLVHGAQAGGYWVIATADPHEGEEPAEHEMLIALSTAHTPDDIRESWLVHERDADEPRWIPEPTFTVRCVTESVAMCPYGDIVLTGLHKRHNIHDTRMGLYEFSELLFQSRPVFYHAETDEYLYFRDNMWQVGPEVGGKQGSMFVMDYSYDPEFITNTWVVFNRKYFAPDDGLKVTCPNVTEVDTDVVPDYGELEPIEPGMGTVGEDCAPGYCLNDGSCYVTRKGINVCLCRSGYTGARCGEVVTCPAPPPITHGTPILPPQDEEPIYNFLSVVKYTCQHGYRLNSQSDGAVCDGNGRWSNVPRCLAGNFHFTPQAGVLSHIIKPNPEDVIQNDGHVRRSRSSRRTPRTHH